ncbi:MAG TPA: acyl-CoA thioesterase [Anaerolineales bacterium]|nr:acyl-CoA thioesterase [Anaerolineales bacterium]
MTATSTLPGKRVSESHVVLAQLMQPIHANNHGNVHGGEIMRLMDEAGALACMRHAGRRVVTVAVDRMTFRQPIHLGDLVTFTAEVSYVGRTSLEAEVLVSAENPVTGECIFTNTGYLVYVALDDDGNPVTVPPLLPETEEQHQRMEAGKQRQQHRIGKRN